MKRAVFFTLFALLTSTTLFAQTPCPSEIQADDATALNKLDGGCKPELGQTAPVKFDFPDANPQNIEEKAKPAAEKATNSDNKAAKRPMPETCTYSAYAWDTKKGRSTDHFRVSKPYSEVTDNERDPNAPECTICIEDQVEIDPKEIGINHGKIRVCHVYADQVKSALSQIAASGEFNIEKLEGYRPGKTRGPVDDNGLRTVWSQHSYGTALDINSHRNAIYTNCPEKIKNSANDVKTCKRGIGGEYNPKKYPKLSIVKDGIVYRLMTEFWKWGGEIKGDTKDIMHFSVTGY